MKLAVVIAALALAPAASAAAPPGFTEAKVLEPAASSVAGKPVQVYCAPTDLDLRDYGRATYGVYIVGELGFAPVGTGPIFLGQSVCWPLRDKLRGKRVDSPDLASSILTLTHESVHARGVSDEGQTECAAIHTMPRVAVKFFHVKTGNALRALMSDAWGAHRAEAPEYQTVC